MIYALIFSLLSGFFTTERTIADEVIGATNQYRLSIELDSLISDPFLNELALSHSHAMANKIREFGHDGFSDRAKKAKHAMKIKRFAENVFYCDDGCTARDVVKSWLESKGHRMNIEGPYTRVGVAVVSDGEGGLYFTQIFAGFE